MLSYKTNNSNTIYVNYYYLNQARKKKNKPVSKSKVNKQEELNKTFRSIFTPLPYGFKLYSKKYGEGKVVYSDNEGNLSVEFEIRTIKFLYPDVLRNGYLSMKPIV